MNNLQKITENIELDKRLDDIFVSLTIVFLGHPISLIFVALLFGVIFYRFAHPYRPPERIGIFTVLTALSAILISPEPNLVFLTLVLFSGLFRVIISLF